MRAFLLWVGVAALGLVALAGLAIADPLAPGPEPQTDRRPLVGDDGSYAGVGIGDSPRKVRTRFGRCQSSTSQPPSPLAYGSLEEDAGVPSGSRLPTPDSGSPSPAEEPDRSLSCRLVAFGATQGEIYSVDVVDPAAQTPRGIGRGDPLTRAGDAYPEVRCEMNYEDTERTTFPQCHGRLRGGPHVWFGGNPIRMIVYSTEPFLCGGSCPEWPWWELSRMAVDTSRAMTRPEKRTVRGR